ncbi:Pycsar system effector family protein [Couchioplanes caeruleus]|uniref:Pycsar effector protein domain-containing protein n=2 Tax=Couchioplanes caeruleus TaxID=56438 RepID=A0A1K0FYC6_9ACTN|nr:Pycsar system effector family protein [Couchioplanes caeruleus]OJF10074.1 hypothetical protein BG844_34080 [Couchioplanes caeruleus subsp. caeruleus]ROP31375.1 hypothetical protein EDD30_4275 [Couchioplanes caeruleus]
MALDDSWKLLQQVNEIVRYADAKAGLVLTLNSVLIGLIAVRVQSDGFFSDHPVPAAALLLAATFLVLSIAFDVAAVMPRLSTPGQSPSLLHFNHIGEQYRGDRTEYVEDFEKLVEDPPRLQREIAAQVWANSMVARRKHTCVRWSLKLLSGALAATVMAAVVAAFGG